MKGSCLGGGGVQEYLACRRGAVLSWLSCRGELLSCLCGRVEHPALLTDCSLMAKTELVVQLESNGQVWGGLESCPWSPCVSEWALWCNTNQFVTTASTDWESQQVSSAPGLLTIPLNGFPRHLVFSYLLKSIKGASETYDMRRWRNIYISIIIQSKITLGR